MLFRRAFGLVAASAMVHLAVTGGTLVCAADAHATAVSGVNAERDGNGSVSGEAMAGMSNQADAPSHAGHVTTAQQPDDGTPPCDAPAPTGCCHAMASCTTVAAFAVVTTVAPASYAAPDVTGEPIDAPPSAVRVPDPPPPKA